MIELEGDAVFDAARPVLWEMILDPEVLARILPGCEKLSVVNENEYQGQMKLKIGPVDGVFRGTVALSDLETQEGFHLVVNGRGPSGVIEGQGRVRLEDTGSGTVFYYTGSGQVSGRMASVGQRVMTSSAKAIIKQSLENLDKQIQARSRPPETTEHTQEAVTEGAAAKVRADSPPPPPSQTEFMLGVAENMLEEFVPDRQQRRLLVGLAGAMIFTLALNWFANVVARRVVRMLEED